MAGLFGVDYAAPDPLAERLGPLIDIFDEEPVDLDTFIKDPRFLNSDWDLSEIQFEAVRQAERVYYPDLYPRMAAQFDSEYWGADLPIKNLLTLQWGKGSGKDMVCRLISARVAYLLMCLKSPQKYFGMPEDDSIHLLNIARNSAQAREAFFVPLTKMVKRGWFVGKARVSRDTIIYDKNIIAISGHSDAESQEGLNIMLGVADEIDAFREQSEMIGLSGKKRESSTSAESILKMLKGSASTRFPKTYKRIAISYPRYIGSTIQKQTDEAKADIALYGNEESIYFASGPYATWEVNPRISGKEDFISDYRKDPIEAASMYECRPARAVDGYFKNMPALYAACDPVTEYTETGDPIDNQPVTVEYILEKKYLEDTGQSVDLWNVRFHISPDFKPKQGARYAMHGDLAIKSDRAGIAMSHVVKYLDTTAETFDPETGEKKKIMVRVPVLRNDFTIGFESAVSEGDGIPPREIQIRWARELAFELRDLGFHIVLFSFDQFQSADSMQILTDSGIESERISADINDGPYKTLRDVSYEGRLSMPRSKLLLEELERLNRNGRKIDHPPGGSKDLSDALACSLVGAIQAMGEESVDSKEVDIGADRFAVGEALAPLAGMSDYNIGNLMPLGMNGMSLHG